MLGNNLGWKISILIFVINAGVGLWLYGQMELTEPTALTMDPKNLEALQPPVPAATVVAQDQPGDAGEKYAQAAAAYDDDEDACEDFAKNPQGDPPPPVQLVMDATNLSDMNLFGSNPQQIVDYQSDHPALDNLAKIGREMETAALRVQKDHPDEARKLLEAAYSLGVNLYRERVDYDEFSAGMGVMDGAVEGLANLEPAGSVRQRMLQDYQQEILVFYDNEVKPIYGEVISRADMESIGEHAGDIFRFAKLSKERMFRVEAILKLGRYRFDSARGADQLAVPRILRGYEGDPDPAVKAAALAAGGLTIEQYRGIH